MRDQIKKGIASLQEQYFYQSPQEMLEELKAGKVSAQMLLMLASEFGLRFTEKKRERNLLDFSDLEHLALQILVKKRMEMWCQVKRHWLFQSSSKRS